MEYIAIVLGWGSPLGIGLFLALLGVFMFLFSKFIETVSAVDETQKKKK